MSEFAWLRGTPDEPMDDMTGTLYFEGEYWDGGVAVTIQVRPPKHVAGADERYGSWGWIAWPPDGLADERYGSWGWIAWPPDGLVVNGCELMRVSGTEGYRGGAIRAAKQAARRLARMVKA
jgi:hypothetical protein